MKKTSVTAVVLTAFCLFNAAIASAATATATTSAAAAPAASAPEGMETCTLPIVANKADGPVAGQNAKGDKAAWVFVEKGKCAEYQGAVEKGELSKLPKDLQEKIDVSAQSGAEKAAADAHANKAEKK